MGLTDKQLEALRIGRSLPLNDAQRRGLSIGWKSKRTEAQLAALESSRAARRQPFPREKRIWYAMMSRCYKPQNQAWIDYGGRGIKVCERWHDFNNFVADMGPSLGRQIDRIDNDGNYEPGNCRWVDCTENCNNRRSNRFVEHQGLRLTIAQWSERTGIKRWNIERRLNAGKDLDWILRELSASS